MTPADDRGPSAEGDSRPSAAPRQADDEAHRPPERQPRRLAVQTAIFSLLTGASRVVGLVREVVSAGYYGTAGPMSAFTIAFQVPNLIRSLFADQALSAAFVPVFSELLVKDKRREAFQLAGALFGLILAVLGALTVVLFLIAPYLMPLFTGGEFTPALDDLTVSLSRILFPIVVLLGLNGLVVGILNAHDHFTIPALAPVVWNVVIIVALVALVPLFEGDDEIYAYAIGVLAGTVVQLAMSMAAFRTVGFTLPISFSRRDPRIRRILVLMLPVTIGLGLINFNLLINSILGSLISEEAPAAIDRAFRIYMLPQGMFSVAVATVLFPTLSRLAARGNMQGLRGALAGGTRQIALLLIPTAAITLALAEPITRLVYERGEFDAQSTAQASEALYWYSFSLPFAGVNLLLTRTFFSLQSPWTPTGLAAVTLLINVGVSAALYEPFGIGGVVVGTAAASAAMAVGQAYFLRHRLNGMEGAATLRALARILLASAALGGVAYGTWWALDDLLGRSTLAQLVSVGAAIGGGLLVYVGAVLTMRVAEADQIRALLAARLRRGGS